MPPLKFLLFIVYFTQIGKVESQIDDAVNNDCTIPFTSNFSSKLPLVLKPNGELYSVFEDNNELKIQVRAGDEFLISCKPNQFEKFEGIQFLKAQCNRLTGNFTIKQKQLSLSDLTCDIEIIEEVTGDKDGCWVTTSVFGYFNPIIERYIILGEACYDMESGVTNFVHFKLGDDSLNELDEESIVYFSKINHDDHYNSEFFHGLNFSELNERIRKSLHIKETPKLKMYHYVDEPLLSSLQFQAIKKLGWNYFLGYEENQLLEALKRDIKRLSKEMKLDVYVGSHGIKEMYGSDGSSMEIFFDEDSYRFPMPDMLWFVVKSGECATAFGVWNAEDKSNYLEKSEQPPPQNSQMFCNYSECERVSWLSDELKNCDQLLCFDVDEFQRFVDNIPVLSNVTDMLL